MNSDKELHDARCDLYDLLDDLGIEFDPEEETEILFQRVAFEVKRLKKRSRGKAARLAPDTTATKGETS